MKNLVLLQEKRQDVFNVIDFCHVADDFQESTVVLTMDGSLIAQNWRLKLEANDNHKDWFLATFVDPHIVCLSKSGAIVSIQTQTREQELVGEFDHGILAAGWSPDAEVLALVAITLDDDNKIDATKNAVLLTMSADFEVLNEIILGKYIENEQVSIAWRMDGTCVAVNMLDASDNFRHIRTFHRDSLLLHSIGRSEDGSGNIVPNLQAPLCWASAGCSNLIASVQRKSKKTQLVVFFEPNGLRHGEFALRSLANVQSLCWNSISDLLAVVLEAQDGSSQVQLWHRSNYHWYLKYEWQYKSRVLCAMFHDEQPYHLLVSCLDEWREYKCCWDVSTFSISKDQFVAFSIDGSMLNSTPLHRAIVPPPMYGTSFTISQSIRHVMSCGDWTLVYLSNGSLCLLDLLERSSSMLNWEHTRGVDIQALRHLVVVKSRDSFFFEMLAVASDDRLIEIELDLTKSIATVLNDFHLDGSVLRIVNWSDEPNGALVELDGGDLLEYKNGTITPSSVEPLLEPCQWIAGLYHAADLDSEPDHPNRQRLIVGLSIRSRLYCHDRLLADSVSSFFLSIGHRFLCFATAGAYCELRSLSLIALNHFDPLMGSEEQDLEGYEPRRIERGAKLIAILPDQPMAVLQLPRGNLEGIYPRSLMLPYVMTKITEGKYGVAFSMMRRHKVDLNLIVDLDRRNFLADGVERLIEDVKPIEFLNLFISTLQNIDVTKDRYRVPPWFRRPSIAEDECDPDAITKINAVCERMRAILLEAEEKTRTMGGRTVADGYYLLPILSTYAKEDPPKLEEALMMIRDKAIAQHSASAKKSPLFTEKAQSSIQYLAFLADYKMLFDTALGIYDYDLARAVARNSQMDPKIYLPLLKRLKSLPEFFSKYEVDVRLERYESALSHLYASGKEQENLDSYDTTEEQIIGNGFDQCLALIEKHGLHRLGLQLFKDEIDKRYVLFGSLGEHLLEAGKGKAALSMFLASEPQNFDGAKRAARSCGDWKSYFALVTSSSSVESDDPEIRRIRLRQLAHDVAQEIAAGRNGSSKREGLADAARILIDYATDVVGAVDMLNSAEMWTEARRLSILHDRHDLVRKIVDAASSCADGMINDFDDKRNQFEKSSERYVAVLQLRKDAIEEAGGMEDGALLDHGDDTGSLFSQGSTSSLQSNASVGSTGSVRSLSSISTTLTVGKQSTFTMNSEHDRDRHKSKFNSVTKKGKKSKRKGPKKNKLRPGSEEELKFLVDTLRNCCIDAIDATVIEETALFLIQVEQVDLSRRLYESFESLRLAVEACQQDRQVAAAKEKIQLTRTARMEGTDYRPIVLPCEAIVDSLECAKLPTVLTDFFSYI